MSKRENTRISDEDIKSQYAYMAMVRDKNDALYMQTGRRKTACVVTYGCQQNEADSETFRGMAREMGYELEDHPSKADLTVVNTCAIREHAEQRVFGNVGALSHAKRRNPSMIIALCGCMPGEPSVVERMKKSYPYVSILLNTQYGWKLPEAVFRCISEGGRIFETGAGEDSVAEGLPRHRDNGVRAWLPIMYGCDNFCAYCIVPHVRGRERSRSPEEIITHARKLISEGAKDITLLGQNVNSYGKDRLGGPDFSDIFRSVADLPGDFRLRFMTSHPKDAGERLFKTMAECPKAARHLHLPFQSGSDEILERMNRGYTAAHYRELIVEARRLMPELVVTSDVIVGFPGETRQDFEQTLQLIRCLRFDALFTFIFSPRKGTAAAEMEDPVSKEEKQNRFDELLQLQNSISSEIHAGCVGKIYKVLVNERSKEHGGRLCARTDGGRLVVFDGDDALVGQFVDVRINSSTTWSLGGEAVGSQE